MLVFCECCVLSGRSLCDGLITRPEESYRLWRVVVCDQETSKNEEAKARSRAVEMQAKWVVTPGTQTNSINRLVIVTETDCVYCAVRAFFTLDNRTFLLKCYLGNFVLNAVTRNINRLVSSGEAQSILSDRSHYLLCVGTWRFTGRDMVRTVSRQPLAVVQDRFQCQVSSWVICGGQSDSGTGFPPSTPIFPCQYHSASAPYTS
jgi:hypothetical protein